MNKTSNYIYYGCPGVVILIISVLTSLRIGIDFGNDPMVRVGVFCACSILLWMLYEAVFQPVATGLCNVIDIAVKAHLKERRSQTLSLLADTEHKETTICETEVSTQPDTPSSDSSDTSTLPSISATYAERIEAYQKEQEAKQAQLMMEIEKYVCYWMSPFIKEATDLHRLIGEIHNWAVDPQYRPTQSIAVHGNLSTNDVRHLIWSIARRLGNGHSHSGDSCAEFIKVLFAHTLKDVELPSLKNFKITAHTDSIPLDAPEPNNLAFHYPDCTANTAA